MGHDPLLEEASKMDSRVKRLARDPFADLPNFQTEYESQVHPELSGPISIRYPNMGDMLAIERLSSGKPYSDVLATFQVLVEKAPASWYRVSPGDATPSLSMSRIPYDPGLLKVYVDFCDWRDSFRFGGSAEPISAPE